MTIERQQTPRNGNPFRSPYFDAAIDRVRRIAPEKEEIVQTILSEIDKEGIENFGRFRSRLMPGVSLPVTHVSVNELTRKIFPRDYTTEHPNQLSPDLNTPTRRKEIVIFGGFVITPDGHPFTPWDIVYDKAISLLPDTIGSESRAPQEVTIYVPGIPTGFTGELTPHALLLFALKGYRQHGKVLAEYIQTISPEADELEQTTFEFQGMSQGAVTVDQTYRNLPPKLQERTRLLLENPAGHHYPATFTSEDTWVAFQIMAGFLYEGSKLPKNPMTKNEFMSQFADALRAKGFDATEHQKWLKIAATFIDIYSLIHGTPLSKKIDYTINQGKCDALSYNPIQQMLRKISGQTESQQKGNRFIRYIDSGHFIDRFNVRQWAETIDKCTSPF